MNVSRSLRLVAFVFVLGAGAAAVQAQDPGLKARMEQRLGSVDSLKDRRLVGENNRGLLEPRGSLTPDDEKVMSDENADRAAVYAFIARQTNTSPEVVGRMRAERIAQSSKPGVWIQAPNGQWYQKN